MNPKAINRVGILVTALMLGACGSNNGGGGTGGSGSGGQAAGGAGGQGGQSTTTASGGKADGTGELVFCTDSVVVTVDAGAGQ